MLVGVVHGVRVAPSLASYGSDPLHLLRVPLLYIQYCTCLLYPFNKLSESVDYMKYILKIRQLNLFRFNCLVYQGILGNQLVNFIKQQLIFLHNIFVMFT